MPPIRMALLASGAVMVFSPSEVCDVRGIKGSAEKEVTECQMGLILGLGPRPEAGFEISAVL